MLKWRTEPFISKNINNIIIRSFSGQLQFFSEQLCCNEVYLLLIIPGRNERCCPFLMSISTEYKTPMEGRKLYIRSFESQVGPSSHGPHFYFIGWDNFNQIESREPLGKEDTYLRPVQEIYDKKKRIMIWRLKMANSNQSSHKIFLYKKLKISIQVYTKYGSHNFLNVTFDEK